MTDGEESADRSTMFPPHWGENVLPNSPLFTKLLRHAYRGRIAIFDHLLNVTKTYEDLLSDALALRNALIRRLEPDIWARLRRGEELFVGVLAAGGYEFAVAMIAALATGAAVVPMSVVNPPEEVLYFVNKSTQIALLSSSATAELAASVVDLHKQSGKGLLHLDILEATRGATHLCPSQMIISSDPYLDDNAAGVVIFTSGTTGKPKGAVLRRAYVHEAALNVIDGYDITHKDRLLHTLPVHHATGIGTSFFPYLVSGACIEFRTHGSFDPAWVWDRLRQGGITVFSGVPTMYLRMMWHYEPKIARMPASKREAFIAGIRGLRCLLCGSSALQQPVQDFFTEMRGSERPGIFVRYGSSELPGCMRVSAHENWTRLPVGCVGTPAAGVDIRVSDEGELLVKSPLMFSGYLFDREATVAAHDPDGWFRTGDICRREGQYVFIIGRASVSNPWAEAQRCLRHSLTLLPICLQVDIIKSGGYKIGALEVEKACLDLPYVQECSVLGVEDAEFGERVAIVLSPNLSIGPSAQNLDIRRLRDDLRPTLPAYKLPTLLRVVQIELPKGQTGKIQKKVLGAQYFPVPGWEDEPEVQVWRSRNRSIKPKI